MYYLEMDIICFFNRTPPRKHLAWRAEQVHT